MYAYTADTSNASNKVTAVAANSKATIKIKNGNTDVENGGNATWETGANTLTITVTYGTTVNTYTITVTKS